MFYKIFIVISPAKLHQTLLRHRNFKKTLAINSGNNFVSKANSFLYLSTLKFFSNIVKLRERRKIGRTCCPLGNFDIIQKKYICETTRDVDNRFSSYKIRSKLKSFVYLLRILNIYPSCTCSVLGLTGNACIHKSFRQDHLDLVQFRPSQYLAMKRSIEEWITYAARR